MYPEVFRIGPFVVRYYGLMYVVALLVASSCCVWRPSGAVLPPERIVDAAFYAFVAGFLGGRLYYVIFKWSHYSANPLKIFAIWEGGMGDPRRPYRWHDRLVAIRSFKRHLRANAVGHGRSGVDFGACPGPLRKIS